jgi:hypothetical protein
MNALVLSLCVAVAFASSSQWLRTPGGKLVWHECTIKVPSGSRVEDFEGRDILVHFPNGSSRSYPRCQHRYSSKSRAVHVTGWQVWSQFNNPTNATFTTMTNYFTVPAAPPNWGVTGILYIFPGLQNDDWVPLKGHENDAPPGFDIIQPVLQYGGDSANGGGKWWEVANWYVTLDDSAVWTEATRVNPGDLIFGNMTMVDSTSWYIGAIMANTGEVNGFVVSRPRLSVQNWAFVTLEVYDVFNCANYPTQTSSDFTKIILTDENYLPIEAKWDQFVGSNECQSSLVVYDSATVSIVFK